MVRLARKAIPALVMLAGCVPPPQAPPQAGPPAVTVAQPLIERVLEWDAYTGRLAAIENVEVKARVDGYLQSHHFEEGQIVQRGQPLFATDPRPYDAALAQASASREEAIANYRKAEAQVREAEAKRNQVSARVDLAKTRIRRNRPLVPSGAISEDEFDEMLSEARQAEADQFAADAEIESARAALTAAEAAIGTAEASVEQAKLDRGYCQVASPITGRAGRRMVTEGNLVSGGIGATTLTTIVSQDPIHANFDADERAMLKYIRLEQAKRQGISRDSKVPVYMALADETGYPHNGYIDFVNNEVDAATGSIRARAIFPNSEQVLTPGAFVSLRIPGNFARDAVLVPDAAIGADQASKFVFVVGEGDKVQVRPIQTGRIVRGLRIVESGLDGSERIVIRGVQRCRSGGVVVPEPGEITPGDDLGLPNDFQPVPPERWLRQPATQTGGPADKAAAQ